MNSKQNNFIQGLDLAESFFDQEVQPILLAHLPQLRYSSALIGAGSEVLGFDTEMSCDHDWGPRLLLFLEEADRRKFSDYLNNLLENSLPEKYREFPVRYGLSKTDKDGQNKIRHHIEIVSIKKFLHDYIDIEYDTPLTVADWLTLPEQKLRSITEGRVFKDEVGLEKMRQQLAYYPHDIWLYLLASAWNRIEQEEHLMGRAGIVADEIGSALIAARLVRDLMRLSFLIHKKYAPYAKWFGTAFALLPCSTELTPIFQSILSAQSWRDRERHLSSAYEYVATMHNSLRITESMPEFVSEFHERQLMVISKGAFSQAIAAKISDPVICKLAQKRLFGSIDQISDNTDILEDKSRRSDLKGLYL